MKIFSINVGMPREVDWNGTPVTTGIFKQPVTGPVKLKKFNLEGDGHADLSVHGGEFKSVYCYPREHYAYWETELAEAVLEIGAFGENFTTEGMLEDEIFIGDRFQIGSAEAAVSEPRVPCFKLGIRFGRRDIVKRFLQLHRPGFYLRVIKEGMVENGNEWKLLSRNPSAVSIRDVIGLFTGSLDDDEKLQRALKDDLLPKFWKESFRSTRL
jgi:MOSC domain-containing protein YiiM